MKEVVYTIQALSQLEDSVHELVEQGYFSEEDYAVDYVRDIFRYFSLNLPLLVKHNAPEYFDRYKVDNTNLYVVMYRKSSRTTWYAFFEELEQVNSIVFLANNHQIGHKLGLNL